MRALVAIPTYGNKKITQWSVATILSSIKEAKRYNHKIDVLILEGKPYTFPPKVPPLGIELPNVFLRPGLDKNYGLAFELNTAISMVANGNYDALLVFGNDVFPAQNYVTEILSYLKQGYDWVSGVAEEQRLEHSEYDYKEEALISLYKEWSQKEAKVEGATDLSTFKVIGDSFNAVGFSKQLLKSIGHVDPVFWPAYFTDNDFARRAQLVGAKMVRLDGLKYYHLWSRTIYNEEELIWRFGRWVSVPKKKVNDIAFPINRAYYVWKWGGVPRKETRAVPNTGVFEYGFGLRLLIDRPNSYFEYYESGEMFSAMLSWVGALQQYVYTQALNN